MQDGQIYHMCQKDEWLAASAAGSYHGSSQDTADGFIHFSTAAQLADSAARHRSGQRGLVLLSVDAAALGAALRWEPARNSDLFPHLYGPLPLDAVIAVHDLPLGGDGKHVLPTMN